jgi:hypothetical protein
MRHSPNQDSNILHHLKRTFSTNLLQIAAAIARSPAVSVTVNPLTTFKNTACSTKAQESRI